MLEDVIKNEFVHTATGGPIVPGVLKRRRVSHTKPPPIWICPIWIIQLPLFETQSCWHAAAIRVCHRRARSQGRRPRRLKRRVCGGTRPNRRPPSTEAEDHETKETHLSAYSSGNRATAVFTLTLHAGTLVPVLMPPGIFVERTRHPAPEPTREVKVIHRAEGDPDPPVTEAGRSRSIVVLSTV